MKKIVSLLTVMLVSSIAFGDLAGYWPLDDPNGLTVSDASGNGKNGVLYAADSSNYPQWITGHDGNGGALEFNANSTGSANCNHVLIDINTTDGLANLGEAFTIALWVRRDALGCPYGSGWPRLVHTNAYDLELALDPDSTDVSGWDPHDFFWPDLGGVWQIKIGVETAEQKILGNWYHMALTCDGNVVKKYINGVQVFSVSAPEPYALQATIDLRLGAAADGSSYLTGALDDVAIWAGTYLPSAEVAKLADGTATPLTVADSGPALPMEMETQIIDSGWKTLWNPTMNFDLNVPGVQDSWYGYFAQPGDSSNIVPWHWVVKTEGNYAVEIDNADGSKYGIEWIDPSWSGYPENIVKMAAYLTPGIVFGQMDKGFQLYRPEVWSWENKDYFKTYARVAAINANGCKFGVRVYESAVGDSPTDISLLTLLGEAKMSIEEDYVWYDFKYVVPKCANDKRAWFELFVEGGTPDTVVYIDECNPVSDQWVDFKYVDINQDHFIDQGDLGEMAAVWLNNEGVVEPRNSGMLVNGDFYTDVVLLDPTDDNSWLGVAPTDWSFSGTGDAGIQRMASRGYVNYAAAEVLALGGSVASYIINDAVLEQTTSQTLVEGQTYYAMAYVLANGWNSWKDDATMTLEVDGVDVASFTRVLTREKWRPIYGTYTATAADAGKQMKVKLSYANTHTAESTDPDYMFIGYVYLGDSVPSEWPEGRDNVIANGGFEDLTGVPQSVVDSILSSDNWGAWLVDDVPAPANWLYEVPAGFNEADQGGIWASGMYGTPLPSPGMNDVAFYTSDTLVLGQVIGSLQAGQKYYLDTACGIINSAYGDTVAWPATAPSFHLELYRIPAGITDGATINAAITSGNANYVKVAEAAADATGNIVGGTGVPASRWQLIGSEYTATAADTNIYVRVYGVGGAGPEFAFSDIYLSTQQRIIPGGTDAFDIAAGMQYVAKGPYTCQNAGGLYGDLNADCYVNLGDLAILASDWLGSAF